MMLIHIGQPEVATHINNAWLYTLESGMHTADIYRIGKSKELVGTQAFAEEIVKNLGKQPKRLTPAEYHAVQGKKLHYSTPPDPTRQKDLVGVDVLTDWNESNRNPNVIGNGLSAISVDDFTLRVITNRGVKVYPDGLPETFCTDHWRCRFVAEEGKTVTHQQIISLLNRLDENNFDFIKTEQLYNINGQRSYSLAQGQ